MAETTKDQFEIAALRQKTVQTVNVMMPGNGTPWEDRGSVGAISAFFRTCWRSLFHHALLLDHIRRPETTGEANKFAAVCAFMWAVALAVSNTLYYFRVSGDARHWEVDGSQFFIESALQSFALFGLVLLLLHMATSMYMKLIAGESQNRIPAVLVQNCFAYSLGPSVLAPIPYVGAGLALVWIFIDMVIAGRRRLYLKFGSALTNAILIFVVVAVIIAGIWAIGWLVWVKFEILYPPSVAPRVIPAKQIMSK